MTLPPTLDAYPLRGAPAAVRMRRYRAMELPNSVAALLIAAFAVLPGVPGERIYTMLVGWDWREDKWWRTLRILTFSLVGLSAYTIPASLVTAPLPVYISPSALERLLPTQLTHVAVAFLGHILAAAVSGLAAGYAIRVLARLTSRSAYSSAWDHFINSCARSRWVTVGLTNGQVYAGYVDKADVSVAASERDIILREPALYDETEKTYRATPYQTMFLLGSTISSIAAVTDPRGDKRITSAGEDLFEKETNGGNG